MEPLEKLTRRISALTKTELHTWTDSRMVQRGEGYLDRVVDVVAGDDFLAANVKGAKTYVSGFG